METTPELSSVDRDLQNRIKFHEEEIIQLKKEIEDSNAIVEIIAQDDCLAECRGWNDPYIDDFASDIKIKEGIHELIEALIKHKGSLESNNVDVIVQGECIEFDYPQTGGTIKNLEDEYFANLYTTSTDYKDHSLGVDWKIYVRKSGYDDVQDALSTCEL
tara:strand:+ start:109 stop:588 length:480 start_codon:yes stop_codon:yes gene_type:complete